MTSAEIGLKLDTERRAMAAWYAGFKTDAGLDMTAEQVGEFNTRNEALAKMQGEYAALLTAEKGAAENETKMAGQGRIIREDAQPAETLDFSVAMKSAFAKAAPQLAGIANGARGTVRLEVPVESKTVSTLAMHYPVAERARTTGMARWYGDVENLFPTGSTSSNAVEYFIQTTDTRNAAAVAEGSAATDSAYDWTKTSDEIETIQAWVPVTREFLADNDGMQSMVEGRLSAELQAKVSQQLLSGTGTTPQIWGAAVRTGVQTQAKGTDPAFDAILKAIELVRVGADAPVSAIVLHPTDWANLLLTRTTDGVYILGNPGGMASKNLWGVPVIESIYVVASPAAGTALVAAFDSQMQIYNNGGIVVEASTEYSTYFTERKVALAVSRRMTLVCYRPTASCKVTGL